MQAEEKSKKGTLTDTKPKQRITRTRSTGVPSNVIIIGIAIALAGVAAVIAIFISSGGRSATIRDYSNIPSARLEDGGFVLGNPAAPVTIIEFADFMCPHCQEYESTIDQFIERMVVPGLARFEYRMFPAVDPTFSPRTAQLVECADTLRPGAFWEAHDLMFSITSSRRPDANLTREFAGSLGVDYAQMLECTNTADQFETDLALGSRLGIQGTPGMMIRYGNGAPQWITYNNQTYDRGGVPFTVLEAVVTAAQTTQ